MSDANKVSSRASTQVRVSVYKKLFVAWAVYTLLAAVINDL